MEEVKEKMGEVYQSLFLEIFSYIDVHESRCKWLTNHKFSPNSHLSRWQCLPVNCYLHILLFILEPTNQKNIFEEEYFKKEQQKVNQRNQENAISFVKAIVLFISRLNTVLTTKEFSKYIHVSSNFATISKTLSPETP